MYRLGNKVPERSSNTEQERYADGLVPTVISPHQWTMMIQQRLVDPGRTPLSQGWRVFDDLASMPRGNITTRWGITTSEVAGNDLESVDQLESDQVSAPVNTSDAAATASSDAISTSFTMARASQRGFASTKKWTEGEIRHLVGLRAQRVPYQVIATVSSPRDIPKTRCRQTSRPEATYT